MSRWNRSLTLLVGQSCGSLPSLLLGLLIGLFIGLLPGPRSALAAAEGAASSAPLPLWEYGVAGAAARIPHYRGSDEYSSYLLPLPYFVYRGEALQAGREGLRGIFFRRGRWESDLSLAGNPPVPGDNTARDGMPGLDALVEAGPALRYYLFSQGERDALFFQANLRAAWSVGFDSGLEVGYQGLVTDFGIIYRDSRSLQAQRIRFHLSTGLQFADSRFHEYFYEVAEDYATSDRPAYRAEAGYGGLQLSGSIFKELTPRLQLGGYARWIASGGAAFVDSPLVGTEHNLVLGAMLIVQLGKSAEIAR